jgi:hypothetical protein
MTLALTPETCTITQINKAGVKVSLVSMFSFSKWEIIQALHQGLLQLRDKKGFDTWINQ